MLTSPKPDATVGADSSVTAPSASNKTNDNLVLSRTQRALDDAFVPGAYLATFLQEQGEEGAGKTVAIRRARARATAAWFQIRGGDLFFDLYRIPELTIERLVLGQQDELIGTFLSTTEAVEAMRSRVRSGKPSMSLPVSKRATPP